MTEQELPEAELDVMGCLWRTGSLTAREIREELHETRPMSHSSVTTLLGRLESKGLVSRQKATAGKAFVYSAVVEPTGTRKRMVRELLNRLFGGSRIELVSSLLETETPTEDELDGLQNLLDELRAAKQQSDRTSPSPSSKRRKS